MQMGPLGEVHVHLGDQLLHHVFIHVCDRSFVSNREWATLLRLGLACAEKHTGECLASHGQTTGDSCCHEIGLCLTDECTVLDKPLHGWIESDPLHWVRGTRVHRSMTVVKIVQLLATGFRQVTPSSPRLLEPAIPNFCAQLFVWSHSGRTS